jgi:hypothetical protein
MQDGNASTVTDEDMFKDVLKAVPIDALETVLAKAVNDISKGRYKCTIKNIRYEGQIIHTNTIELVLEDGPRL